jgi:molybdate transport system substrate-binding protein
VSEILPVKGVDLVGSFPAQIQSWVEMTAGVSVNAKQSNAARELVEFLTKPANVPVIRAKGMEPAVARVP